MATQTVHQCDREGWYIGPVEADESPLEPGVHLIPAGAYEDAPPEPGAWGTGRIPRRTGGRWAMQTPPSATSLTPAEKLAAFLASHPDVAALINNQGGV